MRADICDPSDEAAVERFRGTLRRLGAQLGGNDWAVGTDIYRLQIGEQELTVFSDTWSVDIEGPEDLVQRVLREYEQTVA
jgi:phenylalanyl-tRNA synthetase beta subunit